MLQKTLQQTLCTMTFIGYALVALMPLGDESAWAAAVDQPFTLENSSGKAITQVEVKRSASHEQPWMKFQQFVPDGAIFNLVLVNVQCPAIYKVRVQTADGRSMVSPTVNVCESQVLNLKKAGFDTGLSRSAIGGDHEPASIEQPHASDARFQMVASDRAQLGPSTSQPVTILPAPPPPPTLLPVMFDNRYPDRPLPAKTLANLNTVFLEKGFAPVSCSMAPVVMITVNSRYTACASPTAAYPGGLYKMNVPGF